MPTVCLVSGLIQNPARALGTRMAVSCLHKFVPLSEYSTLDNKAFQFFRLFPGVCNFNFCNTEGRYAGLIHVET